MRSLRAYAYDLLHFARWWLQRPAPALSEITQSTLLEYGRYQLDQVPKPTPQTVNHRLAVLNCLYRFTLGTKSPPARLTSNVLIQTFPTRLWSATACGGFGAALKQPRRVILPLSAEQVATFWRSFHAFRDLALVGLMLLDGLRSCEFSLSNLKTFIWPMRRCECWAREGRAASCRSLKKS